MSLKNWNLGNKPADPPKSSWSPLKAFIQYDYSAKTEVSSPLPQEPPRSGVDSKAAVKKLASQSIPRKSKQSYYLKEAKHYQFSWFWLLCWAEETS